MPSKNISFSYQSVDSISELSSDDQSLVRAALEASKDAYAPYSQFRVGAALLFSDGELIIGSNLENASFPAGTCAERVAIGNALPKLKTHEVLALAIGVEGSALSLDNVFAPCGICRQVLCELEQNQSNQIRLLMAAPSGHITMVDSCSDLLPFHFYPSGLKKES